MKTQYIAKVNEMVRPKKSHPLLPPNIKWKVTARYIVQLDLKKTLRCIRVTSMGIPLTLHLSEKLFDSIFTRSIEHKRTK